MSTTSTSRRPSPEPAGRGYPRSAPMRLIQEV